ncbi:hypothetical protein PHYSODRAFT_527565 [Phytophthora sojae]|uniref:Retrotransposon gag domain-containing protein n=1 Tax=Phytophthora sojae (strain P6497) TaxID=1094619 RepID=G5A8Y8_PHYSP|nr:hypothetical protein PHYSODRAFT_527565 [Phytophthora sojae]EGZ08364.1 hypothetical protein PHYSODRAFT_527565 [Phytophthora sojae]|eukprot:XP_009536536.1 hypothetical protein PHYSODRAFT_527565 [Phytophthora sojae]
MIKWYAAFGLYFHQEQVDYRVGELVMNHTQGKAKDWFLREYHGEQRWSHIVRKMKQRFVTRSHQEDLVAQFFTRTAGVSEYIKILRYKQGLSSVQLLHLLKTKSFDTLDELIEASCTLNPREVARSNDKSSKSSKSFPPKQDKKMDAAKCTSSWCTEKGHTKERCWMLHPELKPKWLKDNNKNKGKGAAAVSKTKKKKLWSVLSMIQSDIAKLKGDLAPCSCENWVFDPGTAVNSLYFQRRTEEKPLPATGVSMEYVEKMNWGQYVKDLGSMELTYANGKTESIRNQTIKLTVFVDNIPGYTADFQLCHIPNQCELMLGVPWKRTRNPVIDWETDRVYTKEEFVKEAHHRRASTWVEAITTACNSG